MTNPTPHGQVPEALEDHQVRKLAAIGAVSTSSGLVERRPIEYRRELEDQFVRGFRAAEKRLSALRASHVQNPAENEHVADDVSKNVAESNTAQQPPTSAVADLFAALEEARSAINGMKVEAETAAQGDEQMMLEACETISNEGLRADMAIRAALASAQQPAPATQQAGEVSDAMVLAALQVQYPATYGQYLRHPADGPKTSIRTEAEIDTARRMIAAALAAAPQPSPMAQPAPATQQAEVRPVTPYTCPKCHALWLHWPAEQTGFGRDTLNCRSADHCHYCEKAGVEHLQRLERIPAALHAPQPSHAAQAAESVPTEGAASRKAWDALWPAARDVVSERRRQVSAEGWTQAHDDHHDDGSLAAAAACYATVSVPSRRGDVPVSLWPRSWSPSWWKPSNPRRNLIKAGALILAEIERLDRAAARAAKEGGAA